ncbi:MAG: serine/threonine-protein kinase [Planctomycetota bacterium]
MEIEEPAPDEGPDGPTTTEVVERLERLLASRRVSGANVLEPIGRRVGGYRIEQVLGRGAFGVVYQARDEQLGRTIALKLPRPEVLVDEDRLQRFKAEAIAAASLDHPAIVPLLEADLDGPVPYLASAYCVGPDLSQWLSARTEPVPVQDAADFVAKLAGAVEYAHHRGILHRDIKPSNVLLEPLNDGAGSGLGRDDELTRYQPRLTDFGLAKLTEGGLQDTRSSLMVGTPLYMAPEQVRGDSDGVSERADVYALGVILFELVTLETPHTGSSYVEVLDSVRSAAAKRLRSVDRSLPVDLDTICEKCLAREPADRYASARELGADLRRFLGGKTLVAKSSTVLDHFRRWTQQPERIAEAGSVMFWFQGLVCVWMTAAFLAAYLIGIVVGDGVIAGLVDLAALTSSHGLLTLLGWLVIKGVRWAFVPAILMSLLMLIFISVSSTQQPVVFTEFYPTTHTRVNTFAALILGCVVEAVYFGLATPAWLRQVRQTT